MHSKAPTHRESHSNPAARGKAPEPLKASGRGHQAPREGKRVNAYDAGMQKFDLPGIKTAPGSRVFCPGSRVMPAEGDGQWRGHGARQRMNEQMPPRAAHTAAPCHHLPCGNHRRSRMRAGSPHRAADERSGSHMPWQKRCASAGHHQQGSMRQPIPPCHRDKLIDKLRDQLLPERCFLRVTRSHEACLILQQRTGTAPVSGQTGPGYSGAEECRFHLSLNIPAGGFRTKSGGTVFS